MDNPQERLRQLDARHAEQRADLLAEIEIAERLPIPPQMVHFASKAEPWFKYERDDILTALPILETYPPLPGRAVEKGSLYVGPKTPDNGTVRWSAPELVCVILEAIHRSHRWQTIEWWTPYANRAARIKVEVKAWPWDALPQCRVRYGSYGDVIEAKHDLPDLGEWKRVKWASGSQDTCRFGLYFDAREKADAWLRKIITPPVKS